MLLVEDKQHSEYPYNPEQRLPIVWRELFSNNGGTRTEDSEHVVTVDTLREGLYRFQYLG